MITKENENQALCLDVEDPDTFFPDPTDYGKVAVAKSICAECPLAFDCLESAMADKDLRKWGIWGGTTPEERATMMRNSGTRLRIFAQTKESSDRAEVTIRQVAKALPSYNKNNPFHQK